MSPPKPPSPMLLLGAGFEFAVVVTLLALAGWWADGRFGTRPWLLLTGLAVGLIGETYKFWKIGQRFFQQ